MEEDWGTQLSLCGTGFNSDGQYINGCQGSEKWQLGCGQGRATLKSKAGGAYVAQTHTVGPNSRLRVALRGRVKRRYHPRQTATGGGLIDGLTGALASGCGHQTRFSSAPQGQAVAAFSSTMPVTVVRLWIRLEKS